MAGLLLGLLILGGASRADALTQAFERATAIAMIMTVFWSSRERGPVDCRILMHLLTAWTALMALQLVPLPPALWSKLPGREILEQFYRTMDRPMPWRPLSLEPDLTANSLFAILVPWAVLLLMTMRFRREELLVEMVLLSFLLLSMTIGALQMVSGGRSLYFYAITNPGSPVGLFSNRNHNAFMAVMIVPLLTRLLRRRGGNQQLPLASLMLITGVAFAVLINILVIGSRMGLVLFLLGAGGSWAMLRIGAATREREKARASDKRRLYWMIGILAVLFAGLAAIFAMYSDRFVALWRISQTGGEEDRLQYLPWVAELIGKYFPIGSGFGTFATAYKIVEPDELLKLSYLNHAHNDILEIAVEGGLVAIALAVVFAGLWFIRSFAVWRPDQSAAGADWIMQARLGSILSGILLIGSATDYPLRTPACAASFVIACYWLFRRKPQSISHDEALASARL